MPDITEESIRRIVREETGPQLAELRNGQAGLDKKIGDVTTSLNEKIDDVASSLDQKIDHGASVLDTKMDTMLTKMDGFLKGLEDEKHERLFGDV